MNVSILGAAQRWLSAHVAVVEDLLRHVRTPLADRDHPSHVLPIGVLLLGQVERVLGEGAAELRLRWTEMCSCVGIK